MRPGLLGILAVIGGWGYIPSAMGNGKTSEGSKLGSDMIPRCFMNVTISMPICRIISFPFT